MIRTTLNWTIKNLKAMRDNKSQLYFDHPIQRQSGQWDGDKLKKSLLIHSILSNYPVPPIYCLKEPKNEKEYSYSVLDGKQRLTSIFDYIDGKYPLDVETPSVSIDDEVYQLGNLYFSDMPTDVQQELLRFKFTIYGFEDADDDLIEEIFFRLNNSTPLSKPQKCMSLTGVENAKYIKSLLVDKFFAEICKFTPLQKRKSDDMCTLFQGMMLLDNRYEGYEYASLSADEVIRYARYIKNNYSEEQKEHLYDIIDYLEKAFPVQEKMLKKINIPMIMLCADLGMGTNYNSARSIYRVGPMYFRQWFSYFFEECLEEYSKYCSSGSTKKEKTLKRIEVMENSFKKYFELEDDELMVETKLLADSAGLTEDDSNVGLPQEGNVLSEQSNTETISEETVNQTLTDDSAEDAEASTSEEESEEDFYASGSLEQSYSEEDSTDSTADSDFEESTDDSE